MQFEVVILGAGFAGIGAAALLKRAGIDDFVVLEAESSVGGTWRDNTYPGAACDVPSDLYSFSFAPWAGWSHRYARQPEIRAYLEACVDRFGLRPRIRLGSPVSAAVWEDGGWTLTVRGERLRARFVVFAIGALRDPRWPEIPCLDGFRGDVLHSARWSDAVPLDGRRVGLIGTGASAIQIGPELAPRVGRLTVFQRTAPWVNRREDRAFAPWQKAVKARVPGALSALRLRTYLRMESRYPLFFGRLHPLGRVGEAALRWNNRRALGDPELARRATPEIRLGCKRILASDDWLPMLTRENVALETRPIASFDADGAVLADGSRVPLDALVCATGFVVDRPLGALRVVGRDGVALADVWTPRPKALLGITVPGFPNAFCLLGPNTALGHSSVVVMIEAQIRYLVQAIQHVRGAPDATLDARPEALAAFVAEVDRRHATRIWTSGCSSWYQASDGSQFAIWPGSTLRYLWRTRRFDPSAYSAERGR